MNNFRRFPVLSLVFLVLVSGPGAHAAPRWLRHAPVKLDAPSLDLEISRITQPLDRDHPSDSPEMTYPQRVLYSGKFAKSASSPVILYLCGEWNCSADHVNYMVAELAQTLGAHVVGVEHRFYGESLPAATGPIAGPQAGQSKLRFLRTEYAIEDVAVVQRKLMESKGLTGRWFAIGGSYGGVLVADYRLAHPELVSGAFPFSAPMEVTPQGLIGYERVASESFGPELSVKVRTASAYILDQVRQGENGKKWVQAQFKLPDTRFDEQDIAAILIMFVPQFSQYSKIANLRNALAATDDPKALAEALSAAMLKFDKHFWQESPYFFVRDNAANLDSVSKWVYQSFTQYGFHYVSNPDASKSLVPVRVDIDYFKTRLGEYLGAGGRFMEFADYPKARLEDLLRQGSRLAFFHGTIDPFIANSVTDLTRPDAQLFSLVVPGAYHCQGMGPAVSDPADLAYPAQKFMMKKLLEWQNDL